ncbi:MAG: M42 family metallopeptidase, partial [Chloroflexota bacterium]
MGVTPRDENTLKDELIQRTSELCRISGAPGFEQDVVSWLAEHFEPYTDEIEIDSMGNLYALRRGDRPGPTLMLSAHSDEIGGVVRAIEPDGFLRFNKLGGVLDALLPGRMVIVGDHFGVVGVKAGHAQTDEERARVLGYTKLYIDVGAETRAEVREMGIRIGDPVTYVSDVHRFTNPDRFCGKALDNRLGCVVLLALLRNLRGVEPAGSLCAAVTVQEEVGLRGAQVAAYRVNPTCAVVLDTIPSNDTPDMGDDRTLPIGIGKGPALRLVSRGDVMHHGMKRLLTETADVQGIPYQLVVHDRSTTDASAVHLQREGIPTGIITIPRRYSHTPVEVADVNDAVNSPVAGAPELRPGALSAELD